VTGFAQFKLVKVDRSTGADTTVGALSSLDFLIEVGLPMDPSCKLKITFPSDMPLTNDFYQVLGAGFSSTPFPPFTRSGNFVSIIGCPKAVDESEALSLSLYDIKNKGYV
jgi:hypothetical protein